MSTFTKIGVGLTAAALLALPLTACSSSSKSSSSPSSASSKPVAQLPDLSKGKTTAVALDSGFVAALKSLKLTPAPVGTATISAAGVATFPITGGNVTYYTPGTHVPYVVGNIEHNGSGLSLTAGTGAKAIKVSLTNFDIDPGNNSHLNGDVTVNGKSAAKNVKLFDLNGNTLKPLQTSGTDAILTGTQVLVSDVAADLLDKTFGTTAVKGGLLVGIATITVATA